MKQIIISGITGFIGGNLQQYLQPQYAISGLTRNSVDATTISYDTLTKDHLDKASAFIHLAGKAHDLKHTSEEKDYFAINTELTKNLFDKFLQSDCHSFIYASSVKAAADKVEGLLEEEQVPNPVTAYGRSKLAAENYILSRPLASHQSVYILRPCMVHGPNNKGNLNLLYHFVAKGIPYPFGLYDNKRSFVSIDNLCFIIKELIENKAISSGIYNIADDDPLSTKELVEIIGDEVCKPAKVINVPKSVLAMLARIGDVIPLPINSERVEKLTENYCVSNDKIKKAIGKPLPLTSRQGIQKTIQSFTKQT